MAGPQRHTPNVPVDKIQADLTVQELWVVKISQIMKTDKATHTWITKHPPFFVTFQPGTDTHEVLQIKKNYVTASYDGRSTKTPCLYLNALTANLMVNKIK